MTARASSMRLALFAGLSGVSIAAGPLSAQTATGASGSPPQPSLEQPSGRLIGAPAWQRLVGNTVVVLTRTGGYTEFFGLDGTVKHLDRDGTSTGEWKLRDQKVCFDFREEDDLSCVGVEIEGTRGAFIDDDTSRDQFEVVPGNAKNL